MGLEPGTACGKCGGTLVRRKDDEPDAVRHRLAVYREQTAPVIAWYTQQGALVRTINAVGSLDDVEARALRALGKPALS
jgi:adenylate kinase